MMFGSRRHRAPNVPLTSATANPNAATAAAAVFKRHESNPSLSAAAAAAALRARPATPTRVADVQTKRTLRRSASVASAGTASDNAQDRPGLHRRGSSGSMTERTFRTPSPHRPGSSGSARRLSQNLTDDTPPVPALPRNMDAPSRQPSRGGQREPQDRAVSNVAIATTPVRVASQKLASGEAPSWFGAAKLGDLGAVRRTDPAMASPPSSPLQLLAREEELPEGARPSSQASSINFSYPTRARRGSANFSQVAEQGLATQHLDGASQTQPTQRGKSMTPPARRPTSSSSADQALVYDPNSRRMVRQADLLAVQQAVLDASRRKTTASKKKKRPPQRAGSHLAAGTMGRAKIDPAYTAPGPKMQPAIAADRGQPERQPQPPSPVEAGAVQATRLEGNEAAGRVAVSPPRPDAKEPEHQRPKYAPEQGQISAQAVPNASPTSSSATRQFAVRRQPSVVREEPEPEDSAEEQSSHRIISDAPDAVTGRQMVRAGTDPEQHPRESPPHRQLPASRMTGPADQRPTIKDVDVAEEGAPKSRAANHGRAAQVSSKRSESGSPARQAHFGPVENLTVKHSPPPRSISPRKSAMKHVSSPRDASPAGDTSEASSSVNQDPPVARKKSARVSFEDGGIGAAGPSTSAKQSDAAPSPASPLHDDRRRWLTSLGRNTDLPELDDDVPMKPRPALPSFGSVRGRKLRDDRLDEVERPLVRPRGEPRYGSPLLPSPPLGSSSDHVIGAVLSNADREAKGKGERRVEGNRRQREPLPPIVTSVEGSGYLSDSSDSSSMISSEFGQQEASLPSTTPEKPGPDTMASPDSTSPKPPKPPTTGSTVAAGQHGSPSQANREEGKPREPEIPAITVSQATPPGLDDKSLEQYPLDVPGGFPEDESDQSASSSVKGSAQEATAAPENGTRKDDVGESTALAAQPAPAQTSSDSESSIYSDAYEDLSEAEDGGFQSLNAVVESPSQQSPRPAARPEPMPQKTVAQRPREDGPKLQTELSSATTAVETPSAESPQDEWERVKAYWKSLTAEKRAQLEREAREEAGIDADREDEKPETKHTKRPVERPNSERRALAVHLAQRLMAQQEQQQTTELERSYMIKPGERWKGDDIDVPPMRKTMRVEAPSPSEGPASLPTGSRFRKSLRAGTAEATTAERPASSHLAPTASRETAGKRRSATQAHPVFENAATLQPSLVRRGSTGSESSFKRSRPARSQSLAFRQSLRPSSPRSAQGEDRASKRFSLRTLSATASAPSQKNESSSVSAPAHAQLRTTLRASSAAPKSQTGLRMPSFSLSYGAGKKSGSGARSRSSKAAGSRFSSRFADSSDEDDIGGAIPAGFHSRFEDSSDDEPVIPVPVPLSDAAAAPTLSPPGAARSLRKESSIASTALPEELEESEEAQESQQAAPATTAAATGGKPAQHGPVADTATLRRTRSGRGQLLGPQAAPSSRTSQAVGANAGAGAADDKNSGRKRSSIMSVLRPRRGKGKGKGRGDGDKIGRPEVSESAARRDTRLERSVGQLERIRSQGSVDDDDDVDVEVDGEKQEEKRVHDKGDGTPAATLVLAQQPSPSTSRSPKLQKKWGSKKAAPASRPASAALASAPAVSATPSPFPVHPAPDTGRPGDIAHVVPSTDAKNQQQHPDGRASPASPGGPFPQLMLARRSTASSSLGTRTLSGGGGGGGGFLHLRSRPQRRASSMGGLEVPPAGAALDAGSLAGASSTTTSRKKRFGPLRRMFGLGE